MNNILFLFTINAIMQSMALVLQGGDLPSSCSGSLHLYTSSGEDEIVTESAESLGHLGIIVSRIRVEGCGCYVLYQGSHGSGRAVFIHQRGDQNIKTTRIRSVYRKACEPHRYKMENLETEEKLAELKKVLKMRLQKNLRKKLKNFKFK